MKKIVLVVLIFLLLGFPTSTKSQTVENIKVEQAGDFINIHYQIANSTSAQVYRVKVLCSINGGMNTEIRSITGDVGDLVVGGKTDYWVVWDVLKDIDDVKSVDFIVRAELIKDNTALKTVKNKNDTLIKRKPNNKKYFNIMASVQFPGSGIGIRAGYMNKNGFSIQYVHGLAELVSNSGINQTDRPQLTRFALDYTRRIINKESFQMHLMVGATLAQSFIKEELSGGEINNKISYNPGGEIGFVLCKGSWTFAATGTDVFYNLVEDGEILNKHVFLTLSLGIRF